MTNNHTLSETYTGRLHISISRTQKPVALVLAVAIALCQILTATLVAIALYGLPVHTQQKQKCAVCVSV